MPKGTGFVLSVAVVLASVDAMFSSFQARCSSQWRAAGISFGQIIRERMRIARVLSPETFRFKSLSYTRKVKLDERLRFKIVPFFFFLLYTVPLMSLALKTR